MKRTSLIILMAFLMISMVGTAFAIFKDTESSAANLVTTGTLDLNIRHGSFPWGEGQTVAEWIMPNMSPGITSCFGHIDLENSGNTAANHVEVGCDYSVVEGVPLGPPDGVNSAAAPDDFARYLEITYFRYSGGGGLITYNSGVYTVAGLSDKGDSWRIVDSDGVSGISLCDLKYDPLNDLPPPGANDLSPAYFEMRVRFHADAGSDLQGDTLYLTMIFKLNQNASQ